MKWRQAEPGVWTVRQIQQYRLRIAADGDRVFGLLETSADSYGRYPVLRTCAISQPFTRIHLYTEDRTPSPHRMTSEGWKKLFRDIGSAARQWATAQIQSPLGQFAEVLLRP